MSIEGRDFAAVVDHYRVTIAAAPSGEDHFAVTRRMYRRSGRRGDIQTRVHLCPLQNRMVAAAKAAAHSTGNGNSEPPYVLRNRGRFSRAVIPAEFGLNGRAVALQLIELSLSLRLFSMK